MATSDCIWTFDDIDDKWDTSCGQAFCFIDGGPLENGMKFCCYCGGALAAVSAVVPPVYSDDEE